jgi:hypothetical protein
MNVYERFITRLKDQVLSNQYYEKHHIIPRYMEGTNNAANIIKLTYRQHILAHLLLYRVYRNIEDLTAYKLMKGLCESQKQAISQMIGEKHKRSGHIYKLGQKNKETGWINSIKTTESLSRGGKAAGKLAKESGQIYTIKTVESCRQGGITQGNRAKETGQIQSLGKRKGLYVLVLPDGREFQHAFEACEATGVPTKVIISRCKQGSLGYSRRRKTQEELNNRWRV